MALTLAAATAIAGGLAAAASGGNAIAQGKLNRKNREWQEKMYNVQRKDALADVASERDWLSPANQMEIYRQAGVSPAQALTDGNAGSPSTRSSQAGSPDTAAPQVDPSVFMMMTQMSQQAEQANLLKEQSELVKLEQVTETIEQLEKTYDAALKGGDLHLQQSTMEELIQARRLANQLTNSDIKLRDTQEYKTSMDASKVSSDIDINYKDLAVRIRQNNRAWRLDQRRLDEYIRHNLVTEGIDSRSADAQVAKDTATAREINRRVLKDVVMGNLETIDLSHAEMNELGIGPAKLTAGGSQEGRVTFRVNVTEDGKLLYTPITKPYDGSNPLASGQQYDLRTE